jgi:HemY protein
MKKLIFIFLLLLVAIGLGFLIEQDAGYVLVSYDQWTVETSLWVAVACLIVFFIVLYIVLRLIRHIKLFPHKMQKRSASRKQQKHLLSMKEGLRHLASGQWALAEKHLAHAAKQNQSPMINYLGAARAAHSQQSYADRDKYLSLAEKNAKNDSFAAKLTRAQLYIDSKHWQPGIDLLQQLHNKQPKHSQVLELLVEAYCATNDWQAIHDLLPKIKKAKILSAENFVKLEVDVYHNLLLTPFEDVAALEKCWKQMPRSLYTNTVLVEAYCQQLLKYKQYARIQDILESFLKKHWSENLVNLYGTIISDNPNKQIKTALGWLTKHPHDAHLQLTLGRLYRRTKLWGKAKEYLHLSLQTSSLPEAHYELGEVLEELHDFKGALDHYRKGLVQALRNDN